MGRDLASAGLAPGGARPVVEPAHRAASATTTDHRGLECLLDLLRDETLRQGWPVTDPVLVQWLGHQRIFCRCEVGAAAWVGCGRGNHGGRAVLHLHVRPSALTFAEGRADLLLATSGGRTAAGPRSTPSSSTASSAIPSRLPPPCWPAKVARTRFYTPPGMLAAILRAADPVVTSNGDRLRFEPSRRCGVYARYDALPGSLDGNVIDTGTTNVDFNPPMRDALARIGGLEPLHLQVGEDVVVRTSTPA